MTIYLSKLTRSDLQAVRSFAVFSIARNEDQSARPLWGTVIDSINEEWDRRANNATFPDSPHEPVPLELHPQRWSGAELATAIAVMCSLSTQEAGLNITERCIELFVKIHKTLIAETCVRLRRTSLQESSYVL